MNRNVASRQVAAFKAMRLQLANMDRNDEPGEEGPRVRVGLPEASACLKPCCLSGSDPGPPGAIASLVPVSSRSPRSR